MPRRRTEPKKPIDYNDPMRHGTKLQQAAARAKKEEWMASEEGQAYIKRMQATGEFGYKLAHDIITAEKPKSLSELSSELTNKVSDFRLMNKNKE